MLKEAATKLYETREAEFTSAEQVREMERVILLKVVDAKWMAHIDDMDQLREGIGLQAYGQRDPLVEYKMSGYEMFDSMTAAIREDTVRILFHIRAEQKVEREPAAKVTGTNKDASAPKMTAQSVHRKSVRRRRFTRTIRAHAVPARSTNSAVDGSCTRRINR